jgi:Flp pilus assembly protein TadD
VGDAPAKPQQEPVVSDDPETNFLAAIKKNPKDYASYSKLGQLYLDAHNFEEAKKIYSHLVKHQPQNSAFFAKLGFSTLQLGLYQQAAIAYEQALGLDDTQPSRYYNLSLALMAQSKYREAMRAVQKALHLDPHSQKYQQALVQLVRLQQEQTQTDQQQPTHP